MTVQTVCDACGANLAGRDPFLLHYHKWSGWHSRNVQRHLCSHACVARFAIEELVRLRDGAHKEAHEAKLERDGARFDLHRLKLELTKKKKRP